MTCTRYELKIRSCKNFSPAFIEGTKQVKTSTFKAHAESIMHDRSMKLHKKNQGASFDEYAPKVVPVIAPRMGISTRKTMRLQFENAYFLAKENLPFSKYEALCELEKRHDVDLGEKYLNDHGCATFTHFIAADLRAQLQAAISRARFFSIQIDAGNCEAELFLAIYLEKYHQGGKLHICNRFFTVRQPKTATGEGLFNCLKAAFEYVCIDDWKQKLVGLGCDGAQANIAERNGLHGFLKAVVPWVDVSWCLAHRVELSVRDALKPTYFATVDELLLQIYYLYKKSPKKCRELQEVATELQLCFEHADMPRMMGGLRPIRACGTRFVAHKVAALARFIDRFGIYINHLATLAEQSTRGAERQALKGYLTKWTKGKVILGCAVFHDILKLVASLSKVLQQQELCIVRAIDVVMKTKSALDSLN